MHASLKCENERKEGASSAIEAETWSEVTRNSRTRLVKTKMADMGNDNYYK